MSEYISTTVRQEAEYQITRRLRLSRRIQQTLAATGLLAGVAAGVANSQAESLPYDGAVAVDVLSIFAGFTERQLAIKAAQKQVTDFQDYHRRATGQRNNPSYSRLLQIENDDFIITPIFDPIATDQGRDGKRAALGGAATGAAWSGGLLAALAVGQARELSAIVMSGAATGTVLGTAAWLQVLAQRETSTTEQAFVHQLANIEGNYAISVD